MDRLTRQQVSDAVTDLGWRLILGSLRAHVAVDSLARGVELAARLADAEHVAIDLRPRHVVLTIQTPELSWVTPDDLDTARHVATLVGELGLALDPDGPRSAQLMEIAIDTMDRAKILPFWRAILGFVDEPGHDDSIVDPLGQLPGVWFQQMDQPRPQRNRIHFDVSVPHDEAKRRIDGALAAGGVLLSTDAAPAFWILADAEGNEACVCTWQGRD
jgi:4a-hydroxytetrahydrobiopterin dehydratase